MNDTDKTGPLTNDMLEELFLHQHAVISKIAAKQRDNGLDLLPAHLWGKIDNRDVAMEISDNLGFAIEELVEARRELPARKPWKQSPENADKAAFTSEMADTLAFILEACIFADITPRELYEAFVGVSEKNVARAEGTY